MQSSQEAIERFIAAAGPVRGIEYLGEDGQVVASLADAVEARVSKLAPPAVLTIRVDLARLPALGFA